MPFISMQIKEKYYLDAIIKILFSNILYIYYTIQLYNKNQVLGRKYWSTRANRSRFISLSKQL